MTADHRFHPTLALFCSASLALLTHCNDGQGKKPADAGQDQQTSASDAAPDGTLASDGLASDRGGDVVPGGDAPNTSAADGRASDTRATEPDGSLDAAADVSTGVDVATGVDGSGPDARPIDGKPQGDGSASVDSDLPSVCQSILIDNQFPPETYPVLYREPMGPAGAFDTQKASFYSYYGLGETDYSVEPVPLTWSALIRAASSCSLIPSSVMLNKDNVAVAARAFLSRWKSLFLFDDTAKATQPSCGVGRCRASFAQDYCGLAVYSSEAHYSGTIEVAFSTDSGCLREALGHFVPMVPVPRNVLLSETAAIQALVGQEVSQTCAKGVQTFVLSATDKFTFPDRPILHVATSKTVDRALEYRLVLPIIVDNRSGYGPFRIYLDAIDATVLAKEPTTICD